MYVASCKLVIAIPDSHSLKQKRAVIRRLRDRVRDKFGAGLSEVGSNDAWQRAELGFSAVSHDHVWLDGHLRELAEFVTKQSDDGSFSLLEFKRDISRFDDDRATTISVTAAESPSADA